MVRHHPNGIRSPHEAESPTKTDMMAHVKHTCGLRWAIPIPLDTQAVQRLAKSELRIGKECWVCVKNTGKSGMGDAEEVTDAFQRGSTWVEDPPPFPPPPRPYPMGALGCEYRSVSLEQEPLSGFTSRRVIFRSCCLK